MLPHKPSDLIELALADLIKCERSKKYIIDMSVWHTPNGVCRVCFAGAVMAQEFDVPYTQHTNGDSFETWFSLSDSSKFSALNSFRAGRVGFGFLCLGRSEDYGQTFDRQITSYSVSPSKFKLGMRKLARDLRAARR